MADDSGADHKAMPSDHWSLAHIMWWTTLTVAVFAVGAVGFVISLIAPFGDSGKAIVFILACWLCTFMGMRMMDNPRMSETFGSAKKES